MSRDRYYKWLVLTNVCLGQFMAALDSRALNIALPTISTDFRVNLQVIQWAVQVYQITLIGLVLSIGRLGDILGRKRIYGSGFVLFTFASMLCGFSSHFLPLVLFRILQATGAAMLAANGRAIATTVFPNEERGKALGFTSMAFHLGFITGPSLGGLIIEALGWRWIFFINIPVGILGTLMALRVLQEPKISASHTKLDPLGALLLLGGLVSFLLALNGSHKAGSPAISFPLLLLSGAVIGLFLLTEMRVQKPILDLTLFRIRLFIAGNVSLLLIAMAHASIGFLMPFYLQGVLRFSPSKVGIITIANSVMIVLFAPVAGWLSDRLGSRLLCTMGAAMIAAAQAAIGTLSSQATPLRIVLPLGLAGTGWALFNSPNNSAIFGSVPREKLGVASGMTVTMSNVGHVLGVAVSSFLFSLWMSSHGVSLEQGSTYQDWAANTGLFTQAFNLSCLAGALSTCVAIFASAVRGSPATAAKAATAGGA